MIDVNTWFRCFEKKPNKKGKYLLQIGFRSTIGSWLNIYIIESKWNGKTWDIPENAVSVSWKYSTPADASKITTLDNIFTNYYF